MSKGVDEAIPPFVVAAPAQYKVVGYWPGPDLHRPAMPAVVSAPLCYRSHPKRAG
jgi:hypothetical protein